MTRILFTDSKSYAQPVESQISFFFCPASNEIESYEADSLGELYHTQKPRKLETYERFDDLRLYLTRKKSADFVKNNLLKGQKYDGVVRGISGRDILTLHLTQNKSNPQTP
jgi:hypothetical protein